MGDRSRILSAVSIHSLIENKLLTIAIWNFFTKFLYMLRTAGKTAGPIGLPFFVDTHGWPGIAKFQIFLNKKKFSGNAFKLVC